MEEIYKKALKVQILSEVALIQVVKKRVRSQERKSIKISWHRNMILSSIPTLLKNMDNRKTG